MARADWPQLIERHTHAVVVSLLARGLRLARARELAAETWSLLYERHQAGLLPVLELPGLAIRQASFLALKEGARGARSVCLEDAPELEVLPADQPSAEARLAARQELALAEGHLAKLPPRAKEIYTLQLEHPDVGHAQLAARVGVSLQRFRQTLCEVRARLRGAIDGDPS
jgi:RNA polymerase sigma-70 factor (ECF subfamily)